MEKECYFAGMKPSEFWSCTYREANEYVWAFKEKIEMQLKNQISLLEAVTEKIIWANPYVENNKHLSLFKFYPSLFDEKDKEIQFMEELSTELREGGKSDC